MIRAELHAHSNHSDGRDNVRKIVLKAVDLGLNALSITDHDTISGSLEAAEFVRDEHIDIEIIPGVEISTTDGHLLAYGIYEDIDKGMSLKESVLEVKKRNGLTAIPHPFQIDRHGVRRFELFKYVDAIEVFNAKFLTGFCNFLSWNVAKKLNKPMIAGSDAHSVETLGYGITLVFHDNVLKGIESGKTRAFCRRVPLRYLVGII